MSLPRTFRFYSSPARNSCVQLALARQTREGQLFTSTTFCTNFLHVDRFGNLDRAARRENWAALRLGHGFIVVFRLNQAVAADRISTAVLRDRAVALHRP